MIDKYQIYSLYKTVKKMWNAKKFNTLVFQDFLNEPLDTYIISQYINDSPRVEYMSNYAISLVNEINCGIISIEEWLMYVFMKCLIDGSLGELKDLNSISKLKDYAIFKKRKFIKQQIDYVKSLINKNEGLDEFFDSKFSLYDLDNNQKNQAYNLYKEHKIDPEFYIQGLLNNKFNLNKENIKDLEYKKFVIFCEMIVKLKKEILEKNKQK